MEGRNDLRKVECGRPSSGKLDVTEADLKKRDVAKISSYDFGELWTFLGKFLRSRDTCHYPYDGQNFTTTFTFFLLGRTVEFLNSAI